MDLARKKVRWHLGHLDALRGIAILGVVLVHSALANVPLVERSGYVWEVAFFGQRGVQLFFVVSAFTLFLSFKNRKKELFPTRNFFLRRFFRLAPLFYLSIFLTFVLLRPAVGPPLDIILSFFFLNGFHWRTILHGAAGGWSIANEACFYALLPLLYRWIQSLRASIVALLVAMPVCFAAIHVGSYFAQTDQVREYFMFLSFLAEFPVFLMGIVAFFVWQEFALSEVADTEKFRSLSALLLVFLFLAFCAEFPSENAKLWAGATLCAILLLALSLHPWKLLVNRVTIFLGKISYSIYLLHFYIVGRVPTWLAKLGVDPRFLRVHALSVPSTFLLTLLITCPVATLSWLWIEEPGIRLGRRLIGILEGRHQKAGVLLPPIEASLGTSSSPDAQF